MSDPVPSFGLQQEEDVAPKWGVLGVMVGTLSVFAILVAWAWYATELAQARVRPSGRFPEERLGPRHEVDEVDQRLFERMGAGQGLNMQRREALRSFGWVDREHGIVSIPIEDAMTIVAEEGQK